MKNIIQLLVAVLFLSVVVCAQTDPIDAKRKIDWTAVGIVGGIPDRTTICETLTSSATAAEINTAIAGCASGQVVFLEAGTYSLSSGITFDNKSNVTLRGAGPTQTILDFSAGAGCGGLGGNICINNGHFNSIDSVGNLATWSAGYTKGTTVITLSSTTNLQVGTLVILDQEDDSNTDNGEVWVCKTLTVCCDECTAGFSRNGNRSQYQQVRVTAINGSDITISPGLYMSNWRSSQNPEAWWSDNTAVTGVGIEDLTVDHLDSSANAGFFINNAYNCWIKNVKSLKGKRNHVWFYSSHRNEVRDSYFYGTQSAASLSYAIETGIGSSANLVQNTIFETITDPWMIATGSVGNVYAYNYSLDDFHVNPNWQMPVVSHHGPGIAMNLQEGNDGSAGFQGDLIHGTSHLSTSFRSRWDGREPGKTMQTNPILVYSFSRYHNIIGNVLGLDSYHTDYEDLSPSGTGGNSSIYVLGWSGHGGTTGSLPNDPKVHETMMRWGNYDTVNDATRWVSGEVPSGDSFYPNAVPGDQTLIDSYYLASRPSWFDTAFGNPPWPPIGPDVTGGDVSGLGGHVNKIPARLCYENTSKTGDILDFDADDCYYAGGAGASVSGSVTLSGAVKVQ
jgi:hypothetical protein